METTDYLKRSAEYVKNLFEQKLNPGLTYHNLEHTMEVVETAAVISDYLSLDQSKKEKILLACWFHDTGIVYSYYYHEEESVKICTGYLRSLNYPESSIAEINSAILATNISIVPKNIIEQVVCDADISHTGKENFYRKSELLRNEWKSILGRNYTDKEWLKNNISFLSRIKYYTKYAQENFEINRSNILHKLKMEVEV